MESRDLDPALRALNRFGLGARLGERARIGDPRAWLRRQLDGGAVGPAPTGAPSDAERAEVLARLRDAQRAGDRAARQAAGRAVRDLGLREMRAALTRRITTERSFVERLVAFWSNHLCVSFAGGPVVLATAGHYERTAIRPHVLGLFEDMVLASARHPAMLVYLDNARSVGPGSRAARMARRRRGRRVGLNENYARELLELHTLGVDGGYGQDDVEALARVLTGWTVAGVGPRERSDREATFVFRPALHEPGPKTVLGVRYEEAGRAEGERAIRDLCRHPSTARFVAG